MLEFFNLLAVSKQLLQLLPLVAARRCYRAGSACLESSGPVKWQVEDLPRRSHVRQVSDPPATLDTNRWVTLMRTFELRRAARSGPAQA